MYRTEKDQIGELRVPADALFGIHSARARENFPSVVPFPEEWYRATGQSKKACYLTYRKFRDAAVKKYGTKLPFRIIEDKIIDALIISAEEVGEGRYFEYFIVPGVQGGAGTSINMNINEIVTNAALLRIGLKPGRYDVIDPIEHANIFQSTNDIIPTSLTVAVMHLLIELEDSVNRLRNKVEELEKENRDRLRPGFTQMQEAVPSSFGLLFSSYNDAFSRDWWRVSKCSERIKQVNAGGGATGTGLGIPRFFIMEIVPELRKLTGLPLAQSENLADSTSNLDKWVEVHSILKVHAVNLEKISSDLRLLASDISGARLISLPARQTGSSIMPGKINPVIPEFIISAAHKVYSNDQLVSSLCSQGCLELNAYLPVIGLAVIETLKLLISADKTLLENLLSGITFDHKAGFEALMKSPSITTALVPVCGYNNASGLAKLMKEKNIDISAANSILGVIDEETLKKLLEPGNLLKLGFSLDEMI
jgi:aspartate ammonia-lyase